MSSYAAQKGRAAQSVRSTPKIEPKPLTAAEELRVAEAKAFILEHMPEMLEIIRDHHAAGNIDGWRAIQSCRKIADD